MRTSRRLMAIFLVILLSLGQFAQVFAETSILQSPDNQNSTVPSPAIIPLPTGTTVSTVTPTLGLQDTETPTATPMAQPVQIQASPSPTDQAEGGVASLTPTAQPIQKEASPTPMAQVMQEVMGATATVEPTQEEEIPTATVQTTPEMVNATPTVEPSPQESSPTPTAPVSTMAPTATAEATEASTPTPTAVAMAEATATPGAISPLTPEPLMLLESDNTPTPIPIPGRPEGLYSWDVGNNGYTNQYIVAFNWSSGYGGPIDEYSYELKRNGQAYSQGSTGGWTSQTFYNLDVGTYTLNVWAVNTSGSSQPATYTFTVERTSPEVTIISPSAGTVIKQEEGNTVEVKVEAFDADSGIDYVEFSVGGLFYVPMSLSQGLYTGTWMLTPSHSGNNTIYVKGVDKAGNTQTETLSFIYDTKPIIGYVDIISDDYEENIMVNCTVEDDIGLQSAKVIVKGPGENKTTTYNIPDLNNTTAFSITQQVTLFRGENEITIEVTDRSGQTAISDKQYADWRKRWTVIAYQDGDNDLHNEMLQDFLELAAIGADDGYDVIGLLDGQGAQGYTQCYSLTSTNPPNAEIIPLNQVNPSWTNEVNMADWRTLYDFKEYAMEAFPSDHYLLILSDHGNGWRDLLEDETSNAAMSVEDLAEGLRLGMGGKLDVVFFDTCLNGMLEVASTIQDSADYIIASQQKVKSEGFNYTELLNLLSNYCNGSSFDPEDFAIAMVDKFRELYQNDQTYRYPSLTVLDLQSVNWLESDLDSFAELLLSKEIRLQYHAEITQAKAAALKSIEWVPNSPDELELDYGDIYDFVYRIRSSINDANIRQAADRILNRLQSGRNNLILNHWHRSTSRETPNNQYHGLGIYIQIPEQYDSGYNQFGSSWATFIQRDITPPNVLHAISDCDGWDIWDNPMIKKISTQMKLEYFLQDTYDDAPCGAKVSIIDKDGLLGAQGAEIKIVHAWKRINQNADQVVYIDPFYTKDGQRYLLPNGEYQIWITARDHDAQAEDFQNIRIKKISFTINIPRHNVDTTIKTPKNPMGHEIIVPGAEVEFKWSDVTLAKATQGTTSLSLSVPSNETLFVTVTKQGYQPVLSKPYAMNNPSFIVGDFIPTSNTDVDTDHDGIPDWWEFKYWIQWNDPGGHVSCDLSSPDSGEDKSMLQEGKHTLRTQRGDGLTNLQTYQLQQVFPNIDPRYVDLLVELDWIQTQYFKEDSFNQTKDAMVKVFEDAGISVHWSTQGNAITIPDKDANEKLLIEIAEVDIDWLNGKVGGAKGSYATASDHIIHAVMAPGWTTINGLNGVENNNSIGGLYLNNPKRVYVFDLLTRNLVNEGVTVVHPGIATQYELAKHMGYTLAHECGHVLGLDEVAEEARANDDIMYQRLSDSTMRLNGDRKFYNDSIGAMDFKNLFELEGPMTDRVIFEPVIVFTPLSAYKKAGEMIRVEAFIQDLDDAPSDPGNIRTLKYSIDNGITWETLRMEYHDVEPITGDEFNYIAELVIPEGTLDDAVVLYYLEARDKDGHVVTHPKGGGAYHSFIIDTTPPEISFVIPPAPFSPNGDDDKDAMYCTYSIQDSTEFVHQVKINITDESGNLIKVWPDIENMPSDTQHAIEWDGRGEDGQVVSEGLYSLNISAVDQAGNQDEFTAGLVVDLTAPEVRGITMLPEVFNSNEVQVTITLDAMENLSLNGDVELVLKPVQSIVSIRKTVPLNITSEQRGQYLSYTCTFNNEDIIDDGNYTLHLLASDEAGNTKGFDNAGTLIVDRTAAGFKVLYLSTTRFIPEAPYRETVTLSYALSESAKVEIEITDVNQRVVRTVTIDNNSLQGSFTWDGKTDGGVFAADGSYTFRVLTTDVAGNTHEDSLSVVKNQIPASIRVPSEGAIVGGQVIIKGTALDPIIHDSFAFDCYKLWYTPGTEAVPADPAQPGNLWIPIPVPMDYRGSQDLNDLTGNVSQRAVLNTLLGVWDTTGLESGTYTLLLVAQDNQNIPAYSAASVTVQLDQNAPGVGAPSLTALTVNPALIITGPLDKLNISYTLTGNPSDITFNVYRMDPSNPELYQDVVSHHVFIGVPLGSHNTFWLDDGAWENIEDGTYRVELIARDTDNLGTDRVFADIQLSKQLSRDLRIKQFIVSDPATSVITPNTPITFTYELSAAATEGALMVYNAQQQLVATLAFDPVAGVHTAQWTPTAEGLYTCKITAIAEGKTQTAEVVLAVSNGVLTNSGSITSPGIDPVKGNTSFTAIATASGEYYPPQDFAVDVIATGMVMDTTPESVNWTVDATREEYLIRENDFREGSTLGTRTTVDVHNNVYIDGWWDGPYWGDYFIEADVSYGVEYMDVPQPVINVEDFYDIVSLELRNDGFKIKCRILLWIHNDDGRLGAFEYYPDHPALYYSEIPIIWSVTGTSIEKRVVRTSTSGTLEVTPNGLVEGATDYSVQLPEPLPGWTIESINTEIADDHDAISTSITQNVSGNMVSGDILAGRNKTNWTVSAKANETYQAVETLTGTATGNPGAREVVTVPIVYYRCNPFSQPLLAYALCAMAKQEVLIDVSYGKTFLDIPDPEVKAFGHYEVLGRELEGFELEIYEKRHDGFKARCYVLTGLYQDAVMGTEEPDYNVYHPKSPEEVELYWSVTGMVNGVAEITGITTGNATVNAGTSEHIPFSITLQPQHGGTLTNIQVISVTLPSDYDDNTNIVTSLYQVNPVSGNTISGTLYAENRFTPGVVSWSKTITLDSTNIQQWGTDLPLCFKGHPLTSVPLDDLIGPLPDGFQGTPDFAIGNINNANVSAVINNGQLTATTQVVDSTWNTSRDQALNDGIVHTGILELNPYDVNITDYPVFAMEGPVDMSANPHKRPVVISDSYLDAIKNSADMNSPDRYQYTYWWDAATQTVIDNPCVKIDPDSWNITLAHPDGSENKTLETVIQPSNPGDLDDAFNVRLVTSETPRVFVEIKGSIANPTLSAYSLMYRKKSTEELTWKTIPVPSVLQVPKTNGTLAYWDVTGLNGEIELVLVTLTASGVGRHQTTVTLGTKVQSSSTSVTYVTSPYNKAYLTFPAGSVTEDTVMTINPVKLSDTDLKLDPGMPVPIGLIFDMQPTGSTFPDSKHPTLTVFMTEEELNGIDPGTITVYHVTGDGKIQPVNILAAGVPVQDANGETVYKFEFDVPGFSKYLLIPEIGTPVFDAIPEKTNEARINVTGTGEPWSIITLYNGDALCGRTQTGENGRFQLEIALTEGHNQIQATLTRIINGQSITGERNLPMCIELDTDVPEIRYHAATPDVITVDGTGVDDSTEISFTLLERSYLTVGIYTLEGANVRILMQNTVSDPGFYTFHWNGSSNTGFAVPDGFYVYKIIAVDMAGNVATVSGDIRVGNDFTPPETTLAIGEPKYEAQGNIWVGSMTAFELVALDLSGVEYTEYKVNDGHWQRYVGPFDLNTFYEEGEHTVYYRSVDSVGNMEEVKSQRVILDKMHPLTTLTIGEKKYMSQLGLLWVDVNTPFVLEAEDMGIIPSGTGMIQYKLNDGLWQTYTGPVNFYNVAEGIHTLAYRAVDHVGNIDIIRYKTFKLYNNLPAGVVTDFEGRPGNQGGEVILSWKTPGEDGYHGDLVTGTAFAIQYGRSRDMVPDVAKAEIIPVIGSIDPGFEWVHGFSGLEKGQEYTFYIWTRDIYGQWSEEAKTASWSMVETEPIEKIETVDNNGNVGRWSDMAIDSYGNPHIVYQRNNGDGTYSILHTSHNGLAWSTPNVVDTGLLGYEGQVTGSGISIVIDQDDRIFTSYYRRESFQNWLMGTICAISEDNGNTWTKTNVHYDNNGWYIDMNTSLAVDSSNTVHISFVSPADNGGYYELYYGTYTGSSWSIQKIVEAGGAMRTNADCAIGIDQNNVAWMSYFNAIDYPTFEQNNTVSCIQSNGTRQVVEFDPNHVLKYGAYNDIAIDKANKRHIVYYESTNKDLKYAKFDGTIWTTYTVDSTGDVGQFASIALDTKGNPFASYYDATLGSLKYVDLTDPSNPIIYIADDVGDVGQYCSIMIDTNNKIHISYFDTTLQVLKYYTKTRGGIPEDMTPPGHVTGITTQTGDQVGEINLLFTVPGDDMGSSKPLDIGSRFVIQYTSESMDLTDEFWNPSDAQVVIPTCKLEPGTQLSYTLKGLTSTVDYQVRIWVQDNSGWWSIPSEIATGLSR